MSNNSEQNASTSDEGVEQSFDSFDFPSIEGFKKAVEKLTDELLVFHYRDHFRTLDEWVDPETGRTAKHCARFHDEIGVLNAEIVSRFMADKSVGLGIASQSVRDKSGDFNWQA